MMQIIYIGGTIYSILWCELAYRLRRSLAHTVEGTHRVFYQPT